MIRRWFFTDHALEHWRGRAGRTSGKDGFRECLEQSFPSTKEEVRLVAQCTHAAVTRMRGQAPRLAGECRIFTHHEEGLFFLTKELPMPDCMAAHTQDYLVVSLYTRQQVDAMEASLAYRKERKNVRLKKRKR